MERGLVGAREARELEGAREARTPGGAWEVRTLVGTGTGDTGLGGAVTGADL